MTAPPTDPIRIRYRMTFRLVLASQRVHVLLWVPGLPAGFLVLFVLLSALAGKIRVSSLLEDLAGVITFILPSLWWPTLIGVSAGGLIYFALLVRAYRRFTPAQRDVTAEFRGDGLALSDGQGSVSLLAWPAIRRIVEARRVLRIEFTAGNACAMPLAAFTPADLKGLWPLLAQAGVRTKRR